MPTPATQTLIAWISDIQPSLSPRCEQPCVNDPSVKWSCVNGPGAAAQSAGNTDSFVALGPLDLTDGAAAAFHLPVTPGQPGAVYLVRHLGIRRRPAGVRR
ncbi:hypothetical protein EV186_10423 [Labedaea rhizosphaerae]|uniref:Uncharacterized protein n=1 Tax=Labedaea rhizosphaerae TaxID=598644 RepID=A0A4R6S9C2_LABRH|nr:hypothetical protein EV186_10423 [Labedaea rhizosphaerae]